MDYQKLTDTFWENVDRLKQAKHLSWASISERTGHSAGALSTAKYMKRAPSVGLAMNLAQVLGTTVEELCGEKQDKARTLRDVLYNATEGLNDINMVSLISFAESLQRTQEEAFPDGINYDWDGYEEGIGFRKFGDRVKDLKKKYLGPEKDED